MHTKCRLLKDMNARLTTPISTLFLIVLILFIAFWLVQSNKYLLRTTSRLNVLNTDPDYLSADLKFVIKSRGGLPNEESTVTFIVPMLISKSYHDVTCKDGTVNRIFIISPVLPNYPQAKFPGAMNSFSKHFSLVLKLSHLSGVVVFRWNLARYP